MRKQPTYFYQSYFGQEKSKHSNLEIKETLIKRTARREYPGTSKNRDMFSLPHLEDTRREWSHNPLG